MGSCLVSIHLTKKSIISHRCHGYLTFVFRYPLPSAKGMRRYNWVSLAGHQPKWYTTLDTKRIQATRKTLDLHVPWQTLLAQLLYHQHPGSKLSIPTPFLSTFLVHAWDQKRKLPVFKQPSFCFFPLLDESWRNAGYVFFSESRISVVSLPFMLGSIGE